jgi:hypothetical protein
LFNSTSLLSQSQFFLNFYLFQNFFINDRLLTNLGHLFIIQRFFLVWNFTKTLFLLLFDFFDDGFLVLIILVGYSKILVSFGEYSYLL